VNHEGTVADLPVLAGELTLRWNKIYPSLLNTFEKLKKLGFTDINGQVSIINQRKEDKNV